jgi:hypothetical protein
VIGPICGDTPVGDYSINTHVLDENEVKEAWPASCQYEEMQRRIDTAILEVLKGLMHADDERLFRQVRDRRWPNYSIVRREQLCDELLTEIWKWRTVRAGSTECSSTLVSRWMLTYEDGIIIILIIILIIIHLLGLAPAGYLTAPDNGP